MKLPMLTSTNSRNKLDNYLSLHKPRILRDIDLCFDHTPTSTKKNSSVKFTDEIIVVSETPKGKPKYLFNMQNGGYEVRADSVNELSASLSHFYKPKNNQVLFGN